jgi:superfamily II DNA or RNA helicase
MTNPLILRDYQADAVSFLEANTRGFVVAPAGSGKTIIAAAALKRVIDAPGLMFAWVANTIEQTEQARAACDRLGINRRRGEFFCAASRPNLEQYHVVIIDEAHHAPAETWDAMIATLMPGATLWGFSATPWHHQNEYRNEMVRDTFRTFFEVPREKLEADGSLCPAQVHIHTPLARSSGTLAIREAVEEELALAARDPKWRWVDPKERERRIWWANIQRWLVDNKVRNQYIVDLAWDEVDRGGSVLVLATTIEHCNTLAGLLHPLADVCHSPLADVCHSKLPAKKRRDVIARFRSQDLAIMIATSLADEGLDVPAADTLILAAGGRSPAKLEQRVGRVLRPFPGKSHGTIHDFHGWEFTMTEAQSFARRKVYAKLGYPIVKDYPQATPPAADDNPWAALAHVLKGGLK